MKKSRFAILLVVAVAAASLWLEARGSIARSTMNQGWEYKFEYGCNEKSANLAGAGGWEMVSFGSVNMNGSGSIIDTCVFKRPKQ